MAPIDRLGWTDGFSISPQGIVFGVRCNAQWLLERIQHEILLPGWQLGPYRHEILYSFFAGGERRRGRRDFTLLYEGSARLARSHDFEAVYRVFQQTLHSQIAANSTHSKFMAGVALVVDGLALAILNADHRWLQAHQEYLSRRKARLLSAKYVVLDPAGLVHPYAIRVVDQNRLLDVGELGLELASEAAPLSRVLMTDHSRVGHLTSAETALQLFASLRTSLGPAGSVMQLSEAVRRGQVRGQILKSWDELPAAI